MFWHVFYLSLLLCEKFWVFGLHKKVLSTYDFVDKIIVTATVTKFFHCLVVAFVRFVMGCDGTNGRTITGTGSPTATTAIRERWHWNCCNSFHQRRRCERNRIVVIIVSSTSTSTSSHRQPHVVTDDGRLDRSNVGTIRNHGKHAAMSVCVPGKSLCTNYQSLSSNIITVSFHLIQ